MGRTITLWPAKSECYKAHQSSFAGPTGCRIQFFIGAEPGFVSASPAKRTSTYGTFCSPGSACVPSQRLAVVECSVWQTSLADPWSPLRHLLESQTHHPGEAGHWEGCAFQHLEQKLDCLRTLAAQSWTNLSFPNVGSWPNVKACLHEVLFQEGKFKGKWRHQDWWTDLSVHLEIKSQG